MPGHWHNFLSKHFPKEKKTILTVKRIFQSHNPEISFIIEFTSCLSVDESYNYMMQCINKLEPFPLIMGTFVYKSANDTKFKAA